MAPRLPLRVAVALSLMAVCASMKLVRIPLENYDQMQFIGCIGVGSPPQRFQVIFDTGSSDIWLPGTNCVDCAGSRRYHAAVSRSHEALNEPFRLEYGSGNATGRIMREQISLFGGDTADETLTLSKVHIGSVSRTTKRLQQFHADGIVGLGLETLATITKPSLLESDPRLHRFSIYINPLPSALPPAQLILGGVDNFLPVAHLPQTNQPSVRWHHFPLVKYPSSSRQAHGFWSIRLHRLVVDSHDSFSLDSSSTQGKDNGEGIVVASTATAIVDSGTSLLLLPRRVFDTTITEIQQNLRLQHDREMRADPQAVSGYACADCMPEMFPALRFSFVTDEASAGVQLKIQTLVLQGTDYVRCDDSICSPQLDAHELFTSRKSKNKILTSSASTTTAKVQKETEADEAVIVLGAIFLRAYYVHFDSVRKTVGFACVQESSLTGARVCPGGWAPKLQFHSRHFSDGVMSWHSSWIFWCRMCLGFIMLPLLVVALALLYIISVVPSSDVEKVLNWFDALSNKRRRHHHQQQQETALKGSTCTRVLENSDDRNYRIEDTTIEEPDLELETPTSHWKDACVKQLDLVHYQAG